MGRGGGLIGGVWGLLGSHASDGSWQKNYPRSRVNQSEMGAVGVGGGSVGEASGECITQQLS